MEARVWRAGLSLFLIFGRVAARVSPADVCPTGSLADSFTGFGDTCRSSDTSLIVGLGVTEGDEETLQKALNLVHKNRDTYVAVLFYASWCPFSKTCRPNFNNMASLFPTVPHFAFEDSVIRPSILSRYGVHGFPNLFLLNSTMRVRYHGSRTIHSLITFYSDVTGIRPTSLDQSFLEKTVSTSNDSTPKERMELENCPFSWARSPEKLLQQDTYLALAASFLLLRLLYFLLPKIIACFKRAWMRHIRHARLTSLGDYSQAYLEQAKQVFGMLNPCKKSNLQEGAKNAKAWASKSLASVAIGEPSSGRAHGGSERR